jgi:hypothetical protein
MHHDKLEKSILNGETPIRWRRNCFPSSRELKTFISELITKIGLFYKFTQDPTRDSYNISAFYNPQVLFEMD